MKMIAAVDRNWGIGYKGELLARISADLKNFKALTIGGTVILGRKTIEGFPGARPLPGRKNIVLSRNNELDIEGAMVVHSIEELKEAMAGQESDRVFVIGGASVYEQLLPYCDGAVITKIDEEFIADAYLPVLDDIGGWETVAESEEYEEKGHRFKFCTYVNNNPENL